MSLCLSIDSEIDFHVPVDCAGFIEGSVYVPDFDGFA